MTFIVYKFAGLQNNRSGMLASRLVAAGSPPSFRLGASKGEIFFCGG